ncbi:MAG: alkaline phosphatase D family protein [Akkermansiaceae bacterium]
MNHKRTMMKIFLILMATACCLSAEISSDVVEKDKTITRIAFGSCNNPGRTSKKPTRIYDAVLQQQPDVFVFLGDNIYGDTEDMELLRKKYQQLGAVEGYQKLQQQCRVLATWDDHDYGVNDGGKSYPKRVESQKEFLDFFADPEDSVRRTRPGIYTSYSFGKDGKKVQIILLDTRYFRDEIPRKKAKPEKGKVGWYEPVEDTSMTLLGDAQWQWLEQQLQVKADVRIICSSIQVLAYEKGMENWGNVPHEQQRLFDLLKKHKANHTVMISGDVHYTELSKVMIGDYPLYDLTSSGMSHTARGWANADNSFRVGKSYWEINAGLIEIDWEKKSLALTSINQDGKKLVEHQVAFSELEFGE